MIGAACGYAQETAVNVGEGCGCYLQDATNIPVWVTSPEADLYGRPMALGLWLPSLDPFSHPQGFFIHLYA